MGIMEKKVETIMNRVRNKTKRLQIPDLVGIWILDMLEG